MKTEADIRHKQMCINSLMVLLFLIWNCFLYILARYEMLQETLSAYRREIATLQDRCRKMSAVAQQCERSIYTMSQDLLRANEKLALEQVSWNH